MGVVSGELSPTDHATTSPGVTFGSAYVMVTTEETMTERRVRQTGKGADGDITSLCNPAEAWSPRIKADAIDDIKNSVHSYFVQETATRANVAVLYGPTGSYLRAIADRASGNSLDNLPDCSDPTEP